VDFFSLWRMLDDGARSDAQSAAAEVGLRRHLDRAKRLAAMMEVTLSATPAEAALRALEHELRPISEHRRLVRLVALSDSPLDGCRVVAGRIWPTPWRTGWRSAPGYLVRRATRWAYRRLVFERPPSHHGGDIADEMILLDEHDAGVRIAQRLKGGAAVWISPRVSSMEPAIPLYARARIVSVDAAPTVARPGDVVLCRLAHGACVLRRIVGINDDEFRVKADADIREEMVIPRGAVLGVCDLVEIEGSVARIEERPFGTLGILRAIVRARRGSPAVSPEGSVR